MKKMKFKAEVFNFYDSAVYGGHIIIPLEVSEQFIKQKTRRVICIINEEYEFQCGLMPKGDGMFFININSEIRKKMKLEIGSEVNVELKKDESKYGMFLPEEFEELLKIDDELDRVFHQLTPGKQRSLLHMIGKPKTSETRLNKAIVISEYLKQVNGKIDFKQLQQAFKDYNQR